MAKSFNEQLAAILKKLKDPADIKATGEFIRAMLVDRVQGRGQGVKAPGSPTSKLKPLAESYIKQRESQAALLSPKTSPSTSNLTRTGAMLDAIEVVVEGSTAGLTIHDADLLERAIYTNQDRPWINVSAGEKTAVKEYVAKLLRKR